jgi:lipopolysaccharide export system permease protein
MQTLTVKELDQLIATQKMRGDKSVDFSLIEKYSRTALPFSAFILTIMGLALSSRKRRGGLGLNIGIGVGLCFSYILFQRFSEMFVRTGLMPPFVAIWLPNVVFTIIVIYLYRLAPK